eukprot:1183954-Prorocentrum_minimum.AAC.4
MNPHTRARCPPCDRPAEKSVMSDPQQAGAPTNQSSGTGHGPGGNKTSEEQGAVTSTLVETGVRGGGGGRNVGYGWGCGRCGRAPRRRTEGSAGVLVGEGRAS